MAPQAMVSSGPSSAAMGSQVDVPPTPEAFQAVPASPRTSPTTRQHDIAPDDHESKRARVEANCEAEHMMCIDSSSGRQLVMRQGTGKVKHVSGKILWVQDAIRDNVFKLSQIPTMWNISDMEPSPWLLNVSTCFFMR